MTISDFKVRNAKPLAKPYKIGAGGGLYLLVQPAGSKLWRFDYRYAGRRKTISLGKYPDTTVALANKNLAEVRGLLAEGIDPSAARREKKAADRARTENTFEEIAREWIGKFLRDKAESHRVKVIRRLERDVFPWIGSRPVAQIEPKEILRLVRRVEDRGRIETAHRVIQNCGQVLRYAVATERLDSDPSRDLRGALPPWKPQHYPSITEPKGVGELLRAIDSFTGTFPTSCALRLAPMLFVRPGELRAAEWSEFNFDNAEWRIPAGKMKARVQHIVPLPSQAIAILQELKPLTGAGRYVFPSTRTSRKPMSENTINAALRRMGYAREQMTGHGFRSTASTILNEQGWNKDAIERQLAHGERDPVRAAYNYAQLLPERRTMMQAWADYLDQLKAGVAVRGDFAKAA